MDGGGSGGRFSGGDARGAAVAERRVAAQAERAAALAERDDLVSQKAKLQVPLSGDEQGDSSAA